MRVQNEELDEQTNKKHTFHLFDLLFSVSTEIFFHFANKKKKNTIVNGLAQQNNEMNSNMKVHYYKKYLFSS